METAATYHRLIPRPSPALLSIVIPVYDEQESIEPLRQRLNEFLPQLPCTAEILLINDGSTDRTLDLLLEWASCDDRIKVVGLARNFGHQIAVTAGLDLASGDAVVVMDADLQDPPEVILEMVREYCKGYDVVYGQRTARHGEGAFKRLTAWGFYRFMRTFVHRDLPVDAGDFRLLSKPCLEALRTMRETHRFLRGMVAWVGFAQTAVRYERAPRLAGVTKYPLRKVLKFAWTAAVSFSPLPLRISLAFGVLAALTGVGVGIYGVGARILGFYTVPGWTSQLVVSCLLNGALLISIGILGEYVGRIFEEMKDRPLYVTSLTANISPPQPKPATDG